MTVVTHEIPGSPPRVRRFGAVWLCIAGFGQIAFIGFILLHYGLPTVAGQWEAWNEKPLIDGHKPGDTGGNVVFILHVLGAAIMTGAGLLQLIPVLRRRMPKVHRWSGRTFIALAVGMALSGLWLVWVRGTYLSIPAAVFVSINAIIILVCSGFTLQRAMVRKFAEHERWALRAFLAASGVWFLRVEMMAWMLLNQGPRGMNTTMSGPADIGIQFGSFILPLLVLELYFRMRDRRQYRIAWPAAAAMTAIIALTAVGIAGTIAFMWMPYL
ncbi:MAG: DUF2306 domain-containing protein [Pseudomonadota bacterium]